MSGNVERIRAQVLSLIDSEFESDAAFEREMELAEKTVNNWRRGRSSSFMKILPTLSERFGVTVGELMDIPIREDSSELSEDELWLLELYRKTHILPKKMRQALRDTLETTINMYLTAKDGRGKAKKADKQ